jgi:hypothetical protein
MSKSVVIESLRAEAQVKRECAAKAFDAGNYELSQSLRQQAADREDAALTMVLALQKASIIRHSVVCISGELALVTEVKGATVRVRYADGLGSWQRLDHRGMLEDCQLCDSETSRAFILGNPKILALVEG